MIRTVCNTDIKEMTTFGLPAECGRLIEYSDPADLELLHARGELSHNLLPLGGGSNMLFTTGKFNGTVIHCTDRTVSIGHPDADGYVEIKAAAGTVLDELCALTCQKGLWGLENLSGIPGEIGGAAVQNVGAYGTELKDVVSAVHCFDTASGKHVTIENSGCRYGYRDSIFKHLPHPGAMLVTAVTLKLTTRTSPNLGYTALAAAFNGKETASLTPQMLRQAVIALRDGKLPSPATAGSAGSFFKNPVVSSHTYEELTRRLNKPVPGHVLPTRDVKLSAAWLIDNAGCKRFKCGGAGVWPSQPLVLVNATGQATGADVVALENAIRNAVRERFGIDLEPEVIHIV